MRKVIVRRRVKTSTTTTPASRRAVPNTEGQPKATKLVDNATLDRFSPAILGLGEVRTPSREIDAIAAVYDLAGFTTFCNQVDQHLVVPSFLSSFLDWLFDIIKKSLTQKNYGDQKALWAELPFMAKFMGDGVLLLWNTRSMSESLICSVVTTLYDIGRAYRTEFYPEVSKITDKPPAILRCGLARGRVFSVGNGRDYIGHCINTASRLQKLSLLTFCFPHRGFNVSGAMNEEYRQLFVKKSVGVRGVGDNELVWVLEEEFNRLTDKQRAMFQNP